MLICEIPHRMLESIGRVSRPAPTFKVSLLFDARFLGRMIIARDACVTRDTKDITYPIPQGNSRSYFPTWVLPASTAVVHHCIATSTDQWVGFNKECIMISGTANQLLPRQETGLVGLIRNIFSATHKDKEEDVAHPNATHGNDIQKVQDLWLD